MLRRCLLLALALGGALGCGRGSAVPEPPLPPNLGDLDPRVVERIRTAHGALSAEPGSAERWAELGMIYSSERLRTLALECFQAAETLEPRQPKWPYRRAVTLALLGRASEAVPAIERSLELEPGYPPSHARLGAYHLELGDLEAAERAFVRATELDSTYPGGWVGLARLHLQRDRNDEAIAILERLRAEDPEDRTFRQLLASAYHQAGRPVTGEPEERLGTEDVPVWNDPWELEARKYRQGPTMIVAGQAMNSGDAQEALRLLLEGRAQGHDSSDTAQQIAAAYLELGRVDEALAELDPWLVREPENGSALLLRARVHTKKGDPPAALADLERVTELQPSFGGAWAALGRMLYSVGEFERADQALRRAIELGTGGNDLVFALGQTQVALRDWQEARRIFEGLVEERPDHADAWVEVALVRNKLGDRSGAEQALQRAEAIGGASTSLLKNVKAALANARSRAQRGAEPAAEPEDER